MKIKIEEHEEKIFLRVLKCSEKYFKEAEPRVAGGWVRDKIMGCSSFDLDIALNGVSGYDFAMKLREMNADDVSSAGLVKCNPEKSKHLETAVLNVDGHFIDFVNLRKETYTSTRIPKIEFGTPYEDAHRRDLTINALFYNIRTQQIEDFTGKGIEDLEKGVIRTPLDPETTFKDDPLRILRIFRFYSKFDFTISNEIYQALKNEELKTQLHKKVSKERINIELFKMINYPKGHLGIFEIIKNGYVECIFDLKEKCESSFEKSIEYFLSLDGVLKSLKEGLESSSIEVSLNRTTFLDSSHSTVYFNKHQITKGQSSMMDSTVSINNNHNIVLESQFKDSSYSSILLNNRIQSSDNSVYFNDTILSGNISKSSSESVYLQQTTLPALDIPESHLSSRWIFNIYIILNNYSKKNITINKKQVFFNVNLVKTSLVCSNRISDTIKGIEKGLINLESIDFSDLSLYNLFLVVYYLKDLWFEILVLEMARRKDDYDILMSFTRSIIQNSIPDRLVYKSPLDVSIFKSELDIESRHITFFSAESVIYKHSHQEISRKDLMTYLKENKKAIIAKHSSFK